MLRNFWARDVAKAGGRLNRLVAMANNKAEALQIGRRMEKMPYISEHLSSLRQEITDLRNLNERCSQKGPRTALDQAALELRTNRLREIKQELSKMLDRPGDPAIWWERFRTSGRTV